MTLKFDKRRVRLWKGTGKLGDVNIGIRFNRGKSNKEINTIYKMTKLLLTLKYGQGKK